MSSKKIDKHDLTQQAEIHRRTFEEEIGSRHMYGPMQTWDEKVFVTLLFICLLPVSVSMWEVDEYGDDHLRIHNAGEIVKLAIQFLIWFCIIGCLCAN